jgi:hypothetical protein
MHASLDSSTCQLPNTKIIYIGYNQVYGYAYIQNDYQKPK